MTHLSQDGQYFVKYGVESWLGSEDNGSTIQIEGVILHASDGSEDGDVCGRIRAHVMLANGDDFDRDAWAEDDELDDIANVLFTEAGDWSDGVRALWDSINSSDVFVIEEVFLDKKYRGFGLGLAIAERTISLFSRGCGLAAISPWPTEVNAIGDEDEARTAHRKIGRYSERLGFKNIQNTDLWIRSLEHSMTRDSN